jgi:hypothetical protein
VFGGRRLAVAARADSGLPQGLRPIRIYLKHPHSFDDETIRVMGIAFECARSAIREFAYDETIATKIIELATIGERDPERCAN